jgi:hypothetical protein
LWNILLIRLCALGTQSLQFRFGFGAHAVGEGIGALTIFGSEG